jgi:hypothetical protein
MAGQYFSIAEMTIICIKIFVLITYNTFKSNVCQINVAPFSRINNMYSLLFLDKYFLRIVAGQGTVQLQNRTFSMSFLKSKSRLFIANIEHYINFD